MPARLRALVTVLCAAVLGALLPATAAHAAGRTVQGGRLDWGIKSSFQSYVTGPVAKGSYSLTGGAATVGGSTFRFHSATGTYDGGTGAFRASFSGGVRFLGHRTATGAHQLDLTISRPTVSVSGSTGTLYVDVVSKAKDTGAVTTSRQVPFATLSLGGIDVRGGGDAVVLGNLPATLTAQGARSFAGYYTAGTALDPVSLSADVRPAAPPGQPSSTPTKASKSPGPQETSDTRIQDGAVDWGVRRTFREYVTGDIARGRWTLSSGARDGGALFRFPGGAGTYEDGALTAELEGLVRFTGAHGLDLALGAVRVTVKDGRGTLYADVKSPELTGEKVPLVTFTAGDLKPAGGLVEVSEAPAKLTARGAEAFGGMYRAGTGMDPVSLAVALTGDAKLPALPDLGSAPTASASPQQRAAEPEAPARPVASAASDGDGFPVLPVSLAAGALLLVAAALGAVTVRRRRGRTAATPSEEG
ncbi:HtaA domain-containing protein [Streptomyces sp. TRM S81-3]|uniref:HtaA domain-containing protein n=1 Tax=Streptomyces griseicoloratus TaxID=2752516 RepID=A0A926QPE0_9ACTN|nr:HtaA domain-containing protein [Streptomyces griseicoloratus]MBD0418420.1 HtaA domain-containing protein [Streptomyces griseicoloratus]